MKADVFIWVCLAFALFISVMALRPEDPEYLLEVRTKGALDLLLREEYHTERACKRESIQYYRGSLEVNCRKL